LTRKETRRLDKKEAGRGQKQKKKEKRKEQIVKGRDQGQT